VIKYIFIILILLVSCKKDSVSNRKDEIRGEAFGTYYYIKSADEKDLSKLKPSLLNLVDSINQSMSTYIESSMISKLNRQKSQQVDDMFIHVFDRSKYIYEDTNGYFDPTAGILVNYYGFGSQDKTSYNVSLDSLKKLVGFNLLHRDGNKIIKAYKQVNIDFNSIAKGFAVDKFVQLLKNKGFKNFLIDIGGEVYANGIKKKNKKWRIGIDQPKKNNNSGSRELSAKIKLQNKAMATSGNYRKFKINKKTKKELVHTINPITGKAEPSSVLSASVIADNCMTADAYATALMAMGYKKSTYFLKNKSDLEAFIIYKTKNGEARTYITKGFKKLIID